MKTRIWIFVLSATVVLPFFAWFVWPTPWVHSVERQSTKTLQTVEIQVRVNRFTGKKQSSFGDGEWFDGDIIVD